jgi:hypothetical protein
LLVFLIVPTVKTKNPVGGLKIRIRSKKPVVEMVDKAPAVPNDIGRKKPLKTKNGSDYPKPLTDEDWDCIEVRGAAFFAAHWKAQEGNDNLKLKSTFAGKADPQQAKKPQKKARRSCRSGAAVA